MTLHPLYHRIFDCRLEPGVYVSAHPRPLIHYLSIDNDTDDDVHLLTADHDEPQVSS